MKREDAFKVFRWIEQNKEMAIKKPARVLIEMVTAQFGTKPSGLTPGVMTDIRRETGIIPKGFMGAGRGKSKNKLAELERRIEKLEERLGLIREMSK